MTTIAASPAVRLTAPRVLRSEWTKLRSVRSTLWTLTASLALMIGVGAAFSAVQAGQLDDGTRPPAGGFDPVATSLTGITFAQLGVGVLGVLFVSGEYGTGAIRSSLTVVPRRALLLGAKAGVLAAVVAPVAALAAFGSFELGQRLLGQHGVALTATGALRSLVGAALYLAVVALIGLALGALLRNTAAAISTLVGVFFVLPPLAGLLPASVADHFVQYLPSNSGAAVFGGGHAIANPLSPWIGFTTLCGYGAVLAGFAILRLVRTDV